MLIICLQVWIFNMDRFFFLNWHFHHFKSFLISPKAWDSRSKVHPHLPTLSCLVSEEAAVLAVKRTLQKCYFSYGNA